MEAFSPVDPNCIYLCLNLIMEMRFRCGILSRAVQIPLNHKGADVKFSRENWDRYFCASAICFERAECSWWAVCSCLLLSKWYTLKSTWLLSQLALTDDPRRLPVWSPAFTPAPLYSVKHVNYSQPGAAKADVHECENVNIRRCKHKSLTVNGISI